MQLLRCDIALFLQTSALCSREKGQKTLVVPFVPNVLDVRNQALSGSLEGMRRPSVPLEERDILIYFMGRCSHRIKDPARELRRHVVAALDTAGSDVKVGLSVTFFSDLHHEVFCVRLG